MLHLITPPPNTNERRALANNIYKAPNSKIIRPFQVLSFYGLCNGGDHLESRSYGARAKKSGFVASGNDIYTKHTASQGIIKS